MHWRREIAFCLFACLIAFVWSVVKIGSHFVGIIGLKLCTPGCVHGCRDPPASASQLLGLEVCTTSCCSETSPMLSILLLALCINTYPNQTIAKQFECHDHNFYLLLSGRTLTTLGTISLNYKLTYFFLPSAFSILASQFSSSMMFWISGESVIQKKDLFILLF